MPHFATLNDYRFKEQLDDIRGCDLYGVDNDKLGTIADVIFEHGSGDVKYVVVNTGGWLSSKKFLVPADRIHAYDRDRDALQVDVVKEHIERFFPPYDEKIHDRDEDWRDYEGRYSHSAQENKVWERDEQRRAPARDIQEGPVMHREGSTHMITPQPEEMPAGQGGGEDLRGSDTEPQRLAGKFPETYPSSAKIQMTPAGTENMQRTVNTGNEATPSRSTQDFSRFTGKPVTSEHTPRTLDDGGPQDTSGWADDTKPHEREMRDNQEHPMHHHHEGRVERIDTSPDFRPATVKSPAPLGSMGEEVPSDLHDRGDVPGHIEVAGMRDRNTQMASGPETMTSDNRAMHADDHRQRDRNMNSVEHPIEDVRGTGRAGVSEDDMHSRPERWRRFEELLRRNRVDIEAKCRHCAPAKDKNVA